jgi:hypothetical protein
VIVDDDRVVVLIALDGDALEEANGFTRSGVASTDNAKRAPAVHYRWGR